MEKDLAYIPGEMHFQINSTVKHKQVDEVGPHVTIQNRTGLSFSSSSGEGPSIRKGSAVPALSPSDAEPRSLCFSHPE